MKRLSDYTPGELGAELARRLRANGYSAAAENLADLLTRVGWCPAPERAREAEETREDRIVRRARETREERLAASGYGPGGMRGE